MVLHETCNRFAFWRKINFEKIKIAHTLLKALQYLYVTAFQISFKYAINCIVAFLW